MAKTKIVKPPSDGQAEVKPAKVRLVQVDPRTIMIPDVRVTAQMSDETTEQFLASVKEIGIEEPIICYEVDGQLILSDGKHRLDGALRVWLPLVDVIVKPGTMQKVLCRNLMSGHLRGTHPISEMVRSIEALWKEYQMDSEAISKETGLTRDYVETLQLISQLTPYCRRVLDEGRIKVGHAVALTRIKDPVTQETLVNQAMQFNMKVPEFKGLVDEVLAMARPPEVPLPPREPVGPQLLKCTYCDEAYPVEKISSPFTCQSCAGILHQAMAQARADAAAAREQQAAAQQAKAA